MENRESIILKINLSGIQCEGRKWTKNLLKSRRASYGCFKGGPISSDILYSGMKAFIRIDGKLDYNGVNYDKGIQIQCKVINLGSREDTFDPIEIQLVHTFDENNRINDIHFQYIGIDLTQGHRGHRYTYRGDEIQNHGLGIHRISE